MEIGCELVDWINLAQDREQQLSIVNTVIKFGFHKIWGI
jgi:hypothetical protein